MKLNDEQIRAARSTHAFTVIDAVAGSGKTTTLAERVNWLLFRPSVFPSDIVCLTYTNAAAMQIREKVTAGIQFIGTLHSYCLKIVNEEYPAYCILTDKQWDDYFLEKMIRYSRKDLSQLKSKRIDRSLSLKDKDQLELFDKICHRGRVANYEQIVRVATCRLAYQRKPIHLLVDEYQDSNREDMDFYERLNTTTKFFVGDPNQRIYSFRGAKEMEFGESAVRMNLIKNFRVPEAIGLLTERATNKSCGFTEDREGWKIRLSTIAGIGSIDDILLDISGTTAIICRKNYDCVKVGEVLEKGSWNYEVVSKRSSGDVDEKVSLVANALLGNSKYCLDKLTGILKAPLKKRDDMIPQFTGVLMDLLGDKFPDVNDKINAAMEQTGRWSDWNKIDDYNWTPTKGVISVLTAHKAKGHEFDNVYVYGLSEKQFPMNEEPEEDRIMYVAMTRAKKTLCGLFAERYPVEWGFKDAFGKPGKYMKHFEHATRTDNTEGPFWRVSSEELVPEGASSR